MTEIILITTITFIFSALSGFLFIPMIIRFCNERKIFDIPNARKMHHNAIPRLGGISFLPSMFLAMVLTLFMFNEQLGNSEITMSLWSVYFFVSLMLIYSVGLLDDLVGLGAKPKFFVQIVASVLLPAAGLYINNLYGFLGFHEIPFAVGAPLTVFVIVYIINAYNLIDGIDGLAAGLSLIALGGFLYCFIGESMWLYAILITGLMGVLIPFLYFNLLGKPEKHHKIFMGDSGSLTLGFILGFLVVKYSMDNPNVMFWRPDCLLLAFTFVLVPMLDVARVSLIRLRHHTPIFQADKNHIHHKLIRAGLSQHGALAVILLLAVGYIALNVCLEGVLQITWIVLIDIVLWVLFHQVVNMRIKRNGLEVFMKKEETDA